MTSWPGTALLIRAQTLSIEARPYLERARVLGAGHWHQMSRHVLPNVMPMVFANTTLTVAIAILSETTLSFLGLGDPLQDVLGLDAGRRLLAGRHDRRRWWFLLPPGICVILVVLSFTLIGRALEEIFNPRLRGAGHDGRCSSCATCASPTAPRAGPVPAVRGVDLTVRGRRERVGARRRVRVRQVDLASTVLRLQPRSAVVTGTVLVDGQDVLTMRWGRPARAALGAARP